MRKTPRWLRDKLRTLPPVGDRFGRTITFTAAQERALVDLLQQEHRVPVGRQRARARTYRPQASPEDTMAEALRLCREKPAKPKRR